MAASATGLAYAVIIALSVLLLCSVLQLVQSVHALRRQSRGVTTAPRTSIVLMSTTAVALVLSYVFDISITALTLVKGSQTPPPTGIHLVLTVITMFLGQGLAPALIFISAGQIIDVRVEKSGFTSSDAWSASRQKGARVTDGSLGVLLPTAMVGYLSAFCKAVLDTPTTTQHYHKWLHAANAIYRAVVVLHALLFIRIAMRTLSYRAKSAEDGRRDPIMRISMLYHLTPSLFIRTVSLFVFSPLASSFASPATPASATALLLAFNVFVGLSTTAALQSLLSASMRGSSDWAPEAKTPGEQEVEDGTVPGDTVPKRHRRADSIPLSPTGTSFPTNAIRVREEVITTRI